MHRTTALTAALLLIALLPAPSLGGSTDLAGHVIVLDPGHGGSDPGSEGFDLEEKEVVLDVALRLQELLEAEGATVLLTRTTDTDVSLADRVAVANENDADRFVSIHANNCGGCGGHGTETYYHSSLSTSSKAHDLAHKVQDHVVSLLGTSDRGVKQADFYVLRETVMPAVLTELAFLDHEEDNAILASEDGRQDAARALLFGIQEHLGIAPHDPDTGTGDATPPEIRVTAPDLSAWYRDEVTVTAEIQDENELAWARARLAHGPWQWDSVAPHDWRFDTRTVEDGHRALKLQAQDELGNTASHTVTLNVDNTPPEIQLTAPDLSAWYRGTITVEAGIDDLSGIEQARYRVDDGAWTTLEAPYTWTVDTEALTDGTHTLTIKARDLAGNTATHAATLKIDNTPPEVALTHPRQGDVAAGPATVSLGELWPLAGAVVVGNVTVRSQAQDATSGVAQVAFLVDGEHRYTDEQAPYTWDWPALLEPGERTLEVVATDLAGNTDGDGLAVLVV